MTDYNPFVRMFKNGDNAISCTCCDGSISSSTHYYALGRGFDSHANICVKCARQLTKFIMQDVLDDFGRVVYMVNELEEIRKKGL